MPKLVMSLASRGRPEQLLNTIQRTVATFTLPETLLMVMVDQDDLATLGILSERLPPHPQIQVVMGKRPDTIAEKWNWAMHVAADMYMPCADDNPPLTLGYDEKIMEAAVLFPDGIGAVYGPLINASFPDPIGVSAKLVQKLGYIFPPYFPYWFVDHWIDDIVRMIGRISFADVRTDQSKPGKTQEMREPGWWATFFDAAYLMRRKIAHDIIGGDDFDAPQWQKSMLLRSHPLVEWRSRWVNDNVRGQARQLEVWSGLSSADERYQRVRRAAVEMVPSLLDDYGMDAQEALRFRRLLTPPTTVQNIPVAAGMV